MKDDPDINELAFRLVEHATRDRDEDEAGRPDELPGQLPSDPPDENVPADDEAH